MFARQRGKFGLSGQDLGPESAESLPGLRLAELGRDTQQDVAGQCLVDRGRRHAAVTLLDELQHMETGAGTHGHQAPHRQVAAGLDEQGRVTVGGTQPELAAASAVRRIREFARQRREVLAGTRPVDHALRARLGRSHLLGACVLGQGQQHVREIDRRRQGPLQLLLVAQVLVDLELRHPHLLVDVAFPQAGQHELFTQLLAELGPVDAVSCQALVHLRHIDQVLACDVQFGLVHRRLLDAQAGFTRMVQLRALVDQALERACRQLGHAGQRLLRLGQLACQALGFLTHLVVGDRIRVHDGDDVVGRPLHTGGRRRHGHHRRRRAHGLRMHTGDGTRQQAASQEAQNATGHHGIIRNC